MKTIVIIALSIITFTSGLVAAQPVPAAELEVRSAKADLESLLAEAKAYQLVADSAFAAAAAAESDAKAVTNSVASPRLVARAEKLTKAASEVRSIATTMQTKVTTLAKAMNPEGVGQLTAVREELAKLHDESEKVRKASIALTSQKAALHSPPSFFGALAEIKK